MKIFRGHQHPALAQPCALTIGNFDGVHRGHQAMLAVLKNEAKHRGLPARVMTFEPHPREYFSPSTAPTRISTLRDKLTELARCGIDQAVVLPFNTRLASQSADAFITDVLVKNLQVRYVLVGVRLLLGPLDAFLIWKAIAPYARAYRARRVAGE